MKWPGKVKVVVVTSLMFGFMPCRSEAQTVVSHTIINTVTTGWGYDAFGLMIAAPVPNPAGCTLSDFPLSNGTDPGFKTYYAAALTAWSTNSPVSIVISNTQCSNNRPRIIGIHLER